jgi:CelD/BcsL family acetyltransferase involved in cellulose biosynthesis
MLRATIRWNVPALEITTLERPPAELIEPWRALAVAAENPFALPEWLDAWCAAHPRDRPRILVCRRGDGSLAGVVPLVVQGARRRRVVLAPGGDLADVFAPACAPADAPAVAEAVARELPRDGWELWRLERCLEGSPWPAAAAAAGRTCVRWRTEPPLVVADLSDPDDLMDGRQRREVARMRRRLEADHSVAVRTSEGSEEARRDLTTLLELHAARWGEGTFAPSVRAFHTDFAARAAAQGWLRLHTLEVDGRPAAVLYGWRLGTRAFAYSQAFDPAYARYAVGVSLLAAAVERAAAEGCTHFDMLRGDERHKQRFRISAQPLESRLVARRGSPAAAEALARAGARRAWARLPARGRALAGRFR